MQIPGFKKTADSRPDSSLKPLPPLAVVAISFSRQLFYFYRIAYLLSAGCLLLAIFPWLFVHPAGLALLVIAGWGLWLSYQYQRNLFVGKLWYERDCWSLQHDQHEAGRYQLVGEALCWPWLIILPLRSLESGKCRYLLIASDALCPADRARLRTWLRVCLMPGG